MTAADLDALLDAMTLAEQVALLTGADLWRTVALPRLGVPSIQLTDGPNGARGSVFQDGPTTACFPAGIALAATWDTALLQQAGAALADEARLKGASVLLAPTVNLHRTVLNGRNFECHAEDPWLASEVALALVRGVQGRGVAATIKHFAGNESEYQRTSISSDIPERALRELYLLPFERAVREGGVQAVMTGYNRLNGVFAADHHWLLQQVLRGEWGFDGLVMTDWGAQHDTVQSVLAGCDLEMPGPTRMRGALLEAAVQDGRVPADAVRACARRVLQLIARTGGLQRPPTGPERADDLPAHRALIRRLGTAGAVLLKNAPVRQPSQPAPPSPSQQPLLPLAPQPGQTIALIGRPATQALAMGGGSATVNAHYRSSPSEALSARLPGVHLVHAPGADLHRWVPVLPVPMALDYFNGSNGRDGSGAPVCSEIWPGSERLWIGGLPDGVDAQGFSVRARLRFTAADDGAHQISLIGAGRCRAFVDGVPAVDASTGWRAGEPYFGYGCEEVVARCDLVAGRTHEIAVEFSSIPGASVHALRLGLARALGESDIAAAVDAARSADVAIVFAAFGPDWDTEGLDRPDMVLAHRQDELIARVAAANPRTVVVLQTGAPVALPWLDQVPAVLQAWYPGQECGHTIAELLLGDAEPGGRLPQTWPRRLRDGVAGGDARQYRGVDGHVHYGEGVFIGYRHHERHGIAPQFAFGHGLSYTQFAHEGLRLDARALPPGGVLTLQSTVRNTGARRGSEVVQVYVQPPPGAVPRPPQELKAFAKVELAPGEARDVTLALGMRAFAWFDTARQAWVAPAGRYALCVGSASDRIHQRAEVELLADWVEPVALNGGGARGDEPV
jgi:beta-glucosidase